MLETRVVEADDTGHFRLTKQSANEAGKKQRVWMSPNIRSMLKSSGQSFGTIDLDKEPETVSQLASAEPLLKYQTVSQTRDALA
jgi:hypothetical protein